MEGVAGIVKPLRSLKERSASIFFQLFDTHIQPVLIYGAEECEGVRQTANRVTESISLQSNDV